MDLYREGSHYKMISGWYLKRKMPVPPPDGFPKVGFVVNFVAAGFLYKTDSSVCVIDSFISNPTSDKEERNRALDRITEALLKEAQGFRIVKCDTTSMAIWARAEHHGFKFLGSHWSFFKEL